MSGFQPLIIDAGLIRQVSGSRAEIKFLNFGIPVEIPVISETITITQSFHTTNAPSNVDLRTINGGQIGDLLIYAADRVRIRTGGNILENVDRLNNEAVALILTPIGWMPLIG